MRNVGGCGVLRECGWGCWWVVGERWRARASIEVSIEGLGRLEGGRG